MYAMATSLTPESMYAIARVAYRELRAAGVVAVGEFHYVHHQADGTPYDDRTVMADAVIRAALDEGLVITLLRTAYQRAGVGRDAEPGQRRFCDPDVSWVLRDVQALQKAYQGHARVKVGLAPHSVRAVERRWVEECARYADEQALVMHMHVSEVQGEVDECLVEHGCRPMELLEACGALSERFTAVHGTHLSADEARILGRAKGYVCACPTTERDLGDGLATIADLRDAGVRLCVGIDSHIVTDPVEEIRALETHERLRLRRRVTYEPSDGVPLAAHLWREGSVHGAQALGLASETLDEVYVPIGQPSLALVEREYWLDAIVLGSSKLVSEIRAIAAR